MNTRKTLLGSALVLYFVIAFEVLIMISPFAGFFVRGTDYVVDNTFKHGAFFPVWTEQSKWQEAPVPTEVKGYVDLQKFVKAGASGGDRREQAVSLPARGHARRDQMAHQR